MNRVLPPWRTLLPPEHGSWFMLGFPLVLGLLLRPTWAGLLLGLAACGSGLALFAWSRSIPLSLCAGALAGFGLIVYVASTNTLLQLTTGDRFRGRVMSLYTLMFAGTAPLGALGSGAIAQRWGAPVSTTISAAVMLTGAVLVAWRFTVLARLPGDRVAEPAPIERLE